MLTQCIVILAVVVAFQNRRYCRSWMPCFSALAGIKAGWRFVSCKPVSAIVITSASCHLEWLRAVLSIERRQLELCELLHDVPLTGDSSVAGRRVSSVFAAFVEYLTKKNIGMVRNVQPPGLSGAPCCHEWLLPC